ncbi:MAG: stearoyl-CoA 9-desaturase oxidoreductase [Actinomycetota bacterium]|nr:stearoyl-CoA 9-desaturase oxidoreductase [Actinomycetota bacterium]
MTTTTPRRGVSAGLRGTLARWAGRITTPLVPTDYIDLIDPLRSGTRLRGRIVSIHAETRDAATLVIRPGSGWRSHRPGQFLRLGVDVDGVRHWRCYSITSAPNRADGCLSITVKAVRGGVVSDHLVRHATTGTIVSLDQAAGDFTLDSPTPARILFLTAGSGITPVLGMLRSPALSGKHDIVVVHSAPSAGDVICGGELRMLARAGRIRLVEIHTRTDGRLDPTRIGELVGDITDRRTWACGPGDFLQGIEEHWAATGIADRLRTERFRPALVVLDDGGRITFSATGTTVEADGNQSLLDAGESAGVLMPSGCRMGICFGCVAPLRRGAVRDLRNGALTTATDGGDGVVIQTCVSTAAGNCEIDL